MTAINLNENICDRCGADVGNGGVMQALVVADVDVDTGQVINFHFCRSRFVDGKKVKGCDALILSAAHLKNYLDSNEAYQRPEVDVPITEEPQQAAADELASFKVAKRAADEKEAESKPQKKRPAKKKTSKKSN